MLIYHVTTPKKAKLYRHTGHICKPVRGFDTFTAAMAWAIKVGRKVIYEVSGEPGYLLPDHHNEWGKAWWIDKNVPVENIRCVLGSDEKWEK